MKTDEKCAICGKSQPVSQMGEYWRWKTMFQLRPRLSCHDEKNCKPVEKRTTRLSMLYNMLINFIMQNLNIKFE